MTQIQTVTPVVAAALTVALLAALPAKGQTMNKADLITATPFTVRILMGDKDITANAGLREVKYNKDGTGTRTLADGKVLQGTWRFLDPDQKTVETVAPTGTQTWEILELTPTAYRKRDMKSGMVIEHFSVK